MALGCMSFDKCIIIADKCTSKIFKVFGIHSLMGNSVDILNWKNNKIRSRHKTLLFYILAWPAMAFSEG